MPSPVPSWSSRTTRALAVTTLLALAAVTLRATGEPAPGSTGETPSAPPASAGSTAAAGTLTSAARATALQAIAAVPLHFERNDGQVDPAIRLHRRRVPATASACPHRGATRGPDRRRPRARSAFRFRLDGARDGVPAAAARHAAGRRCRTTRATGPSQWQTGESRTHARVRYAEVYPGIDVVYYGNQRAAAVRLRRRARAPTPAASRLDVDGADRRGARRRRQPALARRRPRAASRSGRSPTRWSTASAARCRAGSSLDGDDGRGSRSGTTTRTRELVIDPVIAYSSWFGASGEEGILDMAVDADGGIVALRLLARRSRRRCSSRRRPAR